MAKDKRYISVAELNNALPTAVSEKYVINEKIGNRSSTVTVFNKYGKVDFKNLSLARAAQLVGQGAPFISEKPQKSAKIDESKGKS